MLTQTTLDAIVYEYQHGGVKSYRHSISMTERKALLKYLFTLPTKCDPACEATHTAQGACRVANVRPIRYNSNYKQTKERRTDNDYHLLTMARQPTTKR